MSAPPPPEKETIWSIIVDRAQLANVTAFVLVIAGLAYGVATRDDNMIKSMALIGTGYIFAKVSS